MPVRNIVRLGHHALRVAAQSVGADAVGSAAVQGVIDDLVDTLAASDGVGLAAPQIGVGLQIFVWLAVSETERDGSEEPQDSEAASPEPRVRVVVDPGLEPAARDLVYGWEGCLSIPEIRGLVPRYPVVRLTGRDRDGTLVDERIEGFEARILQHEFDHLNGVLFLDRMRDLQSLTYEDEDIWQDEVNRRSGAAAEPGTAAEPSA